MGFTACQMSYTQCRTQIVVTSDFAEWKNGKRAGEYENLFRSILYTDFHSTTGRQKAIHQFLLSSKWQQEQETKQG